MAVRAGKALGQWLADGSELRRLLADGTDSVDKTKILATERELWKDSRSLSFLIRTLSNLDAHHILFFLGFSVLPDKR